jgi:hypothetical protein
MSDVTASSSCATVSIPYFVIQEDECWIDCIIKRILLIFQACFSIETINDYIVSFSTLNIQWLTASQIQGLDEETIQQLGLAQLNAFTPKQLEFFSAFHQQVFEEALRQQQLNAELSLNPRPLHEQGDESAGLPVEELTTEQQQQRRLRCTSLLSYLSDPLIQEKTKPLLPLEDQEFFSNPLLKEFVETHAHQYHYATLSDHARTNLRNAVLGSYSVVQYIDQDGMDEAKKAFLLSTIPPAQVALLNEERIRQVIEEPNWKTKYNLISLKELDLFRFLLEPKDILLNLTVEKVWDVDERASIYLSSKLNGWISPANTSGHSSLLEISAFSVDEDGIDDISIKTLTLLTFRRLSGKKINALLERLPPCLVLLLAEKQFRELQTAHLSQKQVEVLLERNEHKDKFLAFFSDDQIRAMQDKFSVEILLNLDKRIIKILNGSLLSKTQIDGLFPKHPSSYRSETLAKFDPGQIRAMQNKLSGEILHDLSDDQTKDLDTANLTQQQVDDLFFNALERGQLLAKFDPKQIKAMQDKLSGYILQDLSDDQTKVLDVVILSKKQIEELFFTIHQRQQILAKFSDEQRRLMNHRIAHLDFL